MEKRSLDKTINQEEAPQMFSIYEEETSDKNNHVTAAAREEEASSSP